MQAEFGVSGKGVLRRPDLRGDSAEAEFGLDFEASNFVDLPGPGVLHVPAAGSNVLASWVGLLKTERRYPTGCPNGELSEALELRLPRVVRLQRDPAPEHHTLSLSGSRIDYRQTVRREGEILKLSRTLTMVATQAVCTTVDVNAQKAFAQKVERSLRAQLLYE